MASADNGSMFEAGHQIAGKYRLEAVLGQGAMGTVWQAKQLGLDRAVAIKVMHPQIAAREEAELRFTREARVAASLDHPSSVAILDFGSDGGVLYLVMELLPGESLRARMNRSALGLQPALTIVHQVATALGAAHRIRLVHRDIKPENVILPSAPDSPAKVVDFGLAFIVDPDEAQHMGRVTMDGSVAGTPAYMSPEQVRGASIGPASDVYSLGCVLYELLAGRPPFTGALGEILARHAYAPPLPVRQLVPDRGIPATIDELVLAMLSKSPNSRPSASRVASLLFPHTAAPMQAGRSSLPRIEREGRSVKSHTTEDRLELPATRDGFDLGVIGELPEDLALALSSSGIRVARWTDERGGESIVWAAGLPLPALEALSSAGKIVVTDVEAGDAGSLARLIHAGVADAVVRPHDADDLIRRLWRAHRLAVR